MSFTPAQSATIKAYILADPVLKLLVSGPGTDFNSVSVAMSAVQASFYVWKSAVPTSAVGTTISYVALAAVTTGNLTQLQLFLQLNPQSFPPTADIQAFFNNTFAGALGGQGQATRDALAALFRRQATRVEQVLANTAGGNGANATPAALTYEDGMSLSDVSSMFL